LFKTNRNRFFYSEKMDNLMKNKISASRNKIFGIACSYFLISSVFLYVIRKTLYVNNKKHFILILLIVNQIKIIEF